MYDIAAVAAAAVASSFSPFDAEINKRHKKHTFVACPSKRKHSIKTFAINSLLANGDDIVNDQN